MSGSPEERFRSLYAHPGDGDFPPIGESFVEFDGTMAGRAEFESVVSQLIRVTGKEWLAALDSAIVVQNEGSRVPRRVVQFE